jgi:hypothetical protein
MRWAISATSRLNCSRVRCANSQIAYDRHFRAGYEPGTPWDCDYCVLREHAASTKMARG